MSSKSAAFINTTLQAVSLFREDPVAWRKLQTGALESRFEWQLAAKQYEHLLYSDRQS